MKLSEKQEAIIKQVATAASRLREARAKAYEEARQQAEARIRDFEIELQKAVAIGEAAGISYSQLAKRGMGLQNGTSARLAAEAGRQFIEAQEVEEAETEAPRYAYDSARQTLRVTFTPQDFAGKIPGITEAQSLEFQMEGDKPVPEGGAYNHPVARLALTPDGRKEIAAYLASTEVAA